MKRGEIYWANMHEPVGRRPVLIATPNVALEYLPEITVVPITKTYRGTKAEVPLGTNEGLKLNSAANCHAIRTIPRNALTGRRIGMLANDRAPEFDAALSFALGITVPLAPATS